MSQRGLAFPVAFDELAMAEDAARLGKGGIEALIEFGRDVEHQGGLPTAQLMACDAEGRDGTRLGGCVKTYVPWPNGRYGAVLIPVTHPARLVGFRVIAFGVRHHPRKSHALNVYEIADRRLNG